MNEESGTGRNDLADILSRAQRNRLVVQDYRPLPDSLEWQLGQHHYQRKGNKGFVTGSRDARRCQDRHCIIPAFAPWPGGHMPVLPGRRSTVEMGILPPVCPRGDSRQFRHATEVGGGCYHRVQYGTISKQRRCLVR
jgi:hypothetical protein